uniref:GREB1 like retinoic acid receptor coactivator n=1 Tax=Eptatretus burgeri TaxID=7764 RepID=A0A8C4RD23_EPTBU
MGNTAAGQLKPTRFEEALHSSIEASLRSDDCTPRPVFSQLYLEAKHTPPSPQEEDEEISDSESPPAFPVRPPPEGCCTTDGFCQAGKDLRLATLCRDQVEIPPGFLLVGAKTPSLTEHILVCAVDRRFLPDETGKQALLGFSGNCVGCGEKGFRYFTEFSSHINLKLSTQPKKQKHLKYFLIRNAHGVLSKGLLISWNVLLPTSGPPKKRHRGWSPSSPPAAGTSALGPHSHGQLSNRTGHGTLPYLYGNVGDIVVSPVLMSCFSAPQYSSKVLDQLGLTPGASPSLETLMLLTVHYLAQLAPDRAPMREELDQALLQLHRLASSSTGDSTGAPPPFLSQLTAVAPSQLPWLARLAACPAGGALRVLVTTCSLGEGLAETLQTLAHGQVAGEAPPPRYVVVICVSCSRGSEFCVLVTGPLQARALSEGMLTMADSMKEIGYELIYWEGWSSHSLLSILCGPGLHGEAHLGLADRLVNCREARESPNLLLLQVSCCPYGLQTQNARISPYNEVYWPSDSSTVSLVYFGLANYLKAIQPGCRPPPLRYDDSYESMADSLLERFPRLHSEVIRAYLLIRQYTATLAWLAARRKPTKTKATDAPTAETLQVLAGLVHHGDPSGYGHMLLLRLPSVQLARVAFERLRHARDSLGLQFCFEVLLTTPTSAGFTLAPHFLQRLRVWRSIDKSDWLPKTFQDLEGLPCILLLSGTSPMGETFPRSLQFCDLRLLTMGSLTRSGLEQELGVTFRYVSRLVIFILFVVCFTENSASPASSDDSIPKSSGGSSDGKAADSEGSSPADCSPTTTTTSPVLSTDAKRNGHLSSGIPIEPKELHASAISGQSHRTIELYTSDPKPSPILPACIIVPKAAYSVLRSGSPPLYLLLPAATNVGWATHLRPPPTEDATPQQASAYYRQWSVARQQHCDHDNRPAEGVSGCFHPRRLLLSGPPQIGKTGAYLQFLRVLNRMLIRLQEVDIYDEGELECGTDFLLLAMLLLVELCNVYLDWGKMHIITVAGAPEEPAAGQMSKRRTVSVMLSRFAVHNTFHHCEICHAYMEPALGGSALYTFNLSRCLLGDDIQLHILVPPSQERYFVFTPQGRQVDSLRLPVLTDPAGEVLRSPVFTPTTGRHEQGLLNLFHALEGSPVPHLLVVHERELPAYQRYWPNHCILALPRELDHSGIGAARLLVQELSRQNLERERARQRALGARTQDVWPFVVLLDDSCVMFYETDSNAGTRYGKRVADLRNVSLKRLLLHLEEMPNITHFAMCGVRRWSGCQVPRSRGSFSFSRCHLHDLVLLNADITRAISYDQHRFSCEDVDFNLRASAVGLLLCRFNSFSVMKKQILVGGQSDFPIQAKLSVPPAGPTSPAQFVCPPDSEYTFLSAPPHFLLERYLRHRGPKLYPLAAQCPDNPVLAVDCYLDLGPQVTICTISSRPDAVRPAGGAVTFSGLLLYLCDSSVTPGFLRVFKFLQGATLCLVCQDRSSLRQAVVRLELEEEWQCRLRDEFQTANCPEERPLFFLTGRRA